MENNIIPIVGGVILIIMGLMGIFNKKVMDKLGFQKLNGKYYIFCLIIGLLILIFTFLYNFL